MASGDLIIFPAWLFDSVPPNCGREHRVSFAFNFMFRQFDAHTSPPRRDGKVRVPQPKAPPGKESQS